MSDPSGFEVADAQDGETTAEGHAAAEGVDAPAVEDDVGSTRTVRQMLMSTGRGQSLDEVESPWDPERGGMTRIMRGIQKATDVDGLPAIADIIIGAGEWWTQLDLGDDQDQSDDLGEGVAP